MIEEIELSTLLIGCGAALYLCANLKRVRQIPFGRILLYAFVFSFMAWFLTVVEGFMWTDELNVLEHLCYALSSLFILLWVRGVLGIREKDQ